MDRGASRLNALRGMKGLGLMCSILIVVLSFLFRDCFVPGYTLFSNDGPLGALMSQCRRLPASFGGGWEDLNSLGFRDAGAVPDITYALLWVLGPVLFSKFYAATTLLFLGAAAWCFFRSLGLVNAACFLGAAAAVLNSNFFSAACWGVAAHPLTIGLNYFALAMISSTSSSRLVRSAKIVLAGLLVGMGVIEGADIGAIFSLYVACFTLFQAWNVEENRSKGVLGAIGRLAVIAVFAAFIAAQSLSVLVTTQIQGVAGTQQDKQTKEQHWDFATQWSLPKRETLGFAVPGVFGYRMDTPDGGAYWGAVGRDPSWDRYFDAGKQGTPPQGVMRFSGGGIYAGVLVVLVGFWAALQSFRGTKSPFALSTRRWVWFWTGAFVISLLLAFGRFAPFYQIVYALPYFSTIRNPAKFCYLCNWSLIVLFGYGINGLWRSYVESPKGKVIPESLSGWWKQVRGFDRRWTLGCVAAIGVVALSWLIFASSVDAFERYLQQVQFDAATAHSLSRFSISQVGVFLLFFTAAVILITLVVSGYFRGKRGKWGVVCLGAFLIVDLARANTPWVVTWNYSQKYASNSIIDLLRERPYEHRVASLPRWLLQVFQVPQQLAETEQYFRQLYGIEWSQHVFLYYNIQSLDVIQMPRMPEDLAAYEGNFIPQNGTELPKIARHWQLTNTRYLLGAAGFLDVLNRQFDPTLQRFRIADRFNIVPKPETPHPTKLEELTATIETNGPFALFEFTGALPRAALYSDWEVVTNGATALERLANPGFDPQRKVLVSSQLPAGSGVVATNGAAGEVKFINYTPKHIKLTANCANPSVLLFNDRFDPNWKVLIDGKPSEVLQCNFLMRGAYLQQGSHIVEFVFAEPKTMLFLSLAGVVLAIGLTALIIGNELFRSPDLQKEHAGTKMASGTQQTA
jgi:hypothetical protein